MNRSSLIAPSSGSYSYLLRPPLGISTTQRSGSDAAVSAVGGTSPLVHRTARDRDAGLTAWPRRVPRIPGHVLAAQRRVRILVRDEVAQLLEAVIIAVRRVQ